MTQKHEQQTARIKSILKAASFKFDTAVFGHRSPLTTSANTELLENFFELIILIKRK